MWARGSFLTVSLVLGAYGKKVLFLMSSKTILSIISILLLLSAFVWKIGIHPVEAQLGTMIVPDDYTKIQWAIGNATAGDTIFIRRGTYYEHLNIGETLTLVGESKEGTVIDGNKTGTTIKVTANNVVISGFTIQNGGSQPGPSYAGVWISGAYANLIGNHIKTSSIGIYVNSFGCNIARNSLTNNGHGISIHSSSEISVEANNFSANTFAISLVASSYDNIIFDNIVIESQVGGHGIFISESHNNTICKNNLANNYHGMWFSNSLDNKIWNNTIIDNELLGIELASSSNNVFYHNNIMSNPTSVRVDTGTSNQSICLWDDGYHSGGNYWHDYTNVDEKSGPAQKELGDDGIWDNPYNIDENNQDKYPSVKPYGKIPGLVVDNTKPNADAGLDQAVNTGIPTTFNASKSIDNIGIIGYFWDFGDGINGTSIITTHVFDNDGTYTVTLTVKDAAGNSETDMVVITVISKEAPSLWVVAFLIVSGLAVVAMLFWKYRAQNKKKKKLRKTR